MSWLSSGDRPQILYVSPVLEPSGAERAQMGVLAEDAAPLVACPGDSANERLMADVGARTVHLQFRSIRHSGGLTNTIASAFRAILSARDLRRILRRHPERAVVYCFTIRPGLIAALAALGLDRTVVWNVTDFLPRGMLGEMIRLIGRVTGVLIICHSETVRRDYAAGRMRRALNPSCHIINPGVELSRFVGVGSEPGAPRGLVIGHVSPTKQTHIAIEIARQVAAQRPDFRLVIVGRAQYRDEDFDYERRLIAEVESDPVLKRCIEFKGYVSEVGQEMKGAGLLLHVRPDEPFGIVVTEAMAAGLPVVAPRAAGPSEVVVDGQTGLLFDDPAQAAGLVLRLLADPAEAVRLGAAGAARAREHFSMDAQVRRVSDVLALATGSNP